MDYRQLPDGTWKARITRRHRQLRVLSGPNLEDTFDRAVSYVQRSDCRGGIEHRINGQRSEVLDIVAHETTRSVN